MKKTHELTLCLGAAALLAACGSDPKPPPAAPAGGNDAPLAAPAPVSQPAADQGVDDNPNRGNINVSDSIREKCGLERDEAYFGYDSAQVTGKARDVLKKIADCFTSGPMKGESMKLVGHADPRGDEDYNLTLGEKRAASVSQVLQSLGLDGKQITTSSRGELDAKGTDEASWAEDRRVDIMEG